MFGFIKEKMKAVYNGFTSKIAQLFGSVSVVDEAFFAQLKELMIAADLGTKMTQQVLDKVKSKISPHARPADILNELEVILTENINLPASSLKDARVMMMVGVNGTGKTSFAGKYAAQLVRQGKKVLLVAGDTFRAAAPEQLAIWAQKIGATVYAGKESQDPSAVIFDGCKKFVTEGFDYLIIDTAGRIQTKANLLNELEKIKRVVGKCLPGETIATLLTVDAMLGQNSLEQAKLFHETTPLDGIVLTKVDGTGKGGIVFSVVEHTKVPVVYLSYGEGVADIRPFNAPAYVKELLRG